jgi:hypothetical protein
MDRSLVLDARDDRGALEGDTLNHEHDGMTCFVIRSLPIPLFRFFHWPPSAGWVVSSASEIHL